MSSLFLTKKRLLFFWIILVVGAGFKPAPTRADGPDSEISDIEESQAVEGEFDITGATGKLIFFPERPRPFKDRHQVKPGEIIPFCFQLKPGKSHFLRKLKAKAFGLRIRLEDQQTPPRILYLNVAKSKKYLEEQEGCFRGEFQIAKAARPGSYQLADAQILSEWNQYYSLRQVLYQLTRADELEIQPGSPPQNIQLSKITSYDWVQGPHVKWPKNNYFKLQQRFDFIDPKSYMEPKSLRVLYRWQEEGKTLTFYEAQCRPKMGSKESFYCRLRIPQPPENWQRRQVHIALEEVSIQDKAGNRIMFADPQFLQDKAGKNKIEFWFEG